MQVISVEGGDAWEEGASVMRKVASKALETSSDNILRKNLPVFLQDSLHTLRRMTSKNTLDLFLEREDRLLSTGSP